MQNTLSYDEITKRAYTQVRVEGFDYSSKNRAFHYTAIETKSYVNPKPSPVPTSFTIQGWESVEIREWQEGQFVDRSDAMNGVQVFTLDRQQVAERVIWLRGATSEKGCWAEYFFIGATITAQVEQTS